MRITKDEYYLNIARAVSKRSTCIRRRYGAIIVKNDEVVATGYNGSARGDINCCDTGLCYREQNNIPKGEQYEKCVSIHAESNAIMSAGRGECMGSTMYLVGFEGDIEIQAKPCLMCERLIKNSGVIFIKGVVEYE